MPYATLQDLIDREPDGEAALLVLADRDGDGVPDAAVVNNALDDADAEANGYLAAGGYTLPLPSTPSILVRICADIAIYRMAKAELLTEERRRRYEDAVRLLSGLSTGKVSLGMPQAELDAARPASRASFDGRARRFGRCGLRVKA